VTTLDQVTQDLVSGMKTPAPGALGHGRVDVGVAARTGKDDFGASVRLGVSQDLEVTRFPHVVGIEEGDPFPACLTDSTIAGRADPLVLFLDEAAHGESRMTCSIVLNHFDRAIGGAIIDH